MSEIPISKAQQLLLLLEQLETKLKQAGLWSDTPPSADAMTSSAPFACDSMSFSMWLQFIFLVKMRALLQQGQPMPQALCLLPMAEESAKTQTGLDATFSVIKQIDALFNQDEKY